MRTGHEGVCHGPRHEGHSNLRIVLWKSNVAHHAFTQLATAGDSEGQNQKEEEMLHGIRILRATRWKG